ncbi:unnamed protein product [Closterium sp. NIES-53]
MVASAVTSGSRLGQASLPVLPPGFRFKPTDEELASHYLYPRVRASDDGRRALSALTDNGNGLGPAPDCSWTNIIASLDVFDCEPWQLPPCCRIGDGEWYFFARRSHKYGHSRRTNRCTTRGYWKATGNDRTVPLPPVTAAAPATTADTAGGERAGEGEQTAEAQGQGQEQYWVPMLQLREGVSVVGMKKTLVFYEGRAPRGKRSDWVMHEYRLEQRNSNAMAANGVGGGSGIGSGRKPVGSLVLCRVFNKGVQPPSDPAVADASQQNATIAPQTAAPPAPADGGAEYRRLEGEGEGEEAQESDEETAEEGVGAGYARKEAGGAGVKVECVTDGLQGQQQAGQQQQHLAQDLLPWLEDLKLLWEVEAADDVAAAAAATEIVPAAAPATGAVALDPSLLHHASPSAAAADAAPAPGAVAGGTAAAGAAGATNAGGGAAHAPGHGEGEWEEERGGDAGTELTTAGSTCASVPAATVPSTAIPQFPPPTATGQPALAAASVNGASTSASAAAAAAAATAAIPPLPPLNILESLPSLMFGSDDIGKMLQAVDGSIMNPYEGLDTDGWLAGPSPHDGEHFAPPSGGVGGAAAAGGGGGGWEQSGRDPNVDAAVAAAAAAAAASGFAVEDVIRGWTEELERIVKQEAPSKRRRCQAAALAAALAGQGNAAALAGKGAVEAEEDEEDSESEDGVGSGRETFLGGSGEESGESDGLELERGRGGVGGAGKAVGASSSSTCSSSEANVLKMQQANARRLALLVAQKCTVSASHERRTSPRGNGREDVATGVEESEELGEQEDPAGDFSDMVTPEDGDQTSEALSSEQVSKNNICVTLRQIVLQKGRPMLVVPPKGRLQ